MNIWHDISADRISPTDFISVTDVNELPEHIFDEVQHFFTIYKQLEGKTTVVKEMGGPMEAIAVIEKAIENYRRKFGEAESEC